ncbi:hypothetical protein [Hyella patelloides]|uniref:hypothetical protein n=1 Tax=Hyella patelloides TaxID=1982969 RepID=UPI001FE48E91|nr:hypothetical protein [Hyella patelloides]
MIVLPSLVTERIESVKAGILSSAVFGVMDGMIILTNSYLAIELEVNFQQWQITSIIDFGWHLAIAFISGFLFGVTYRYVIRGDRNSHLQDGAVLAFGLVRGFALIEGTTLTPLWLLLVIESIISFAFARFSLDFALKFKLIKPFV